MRNGTAEDDESNEKGAPVDGNSDENENQAEGDVYVGTRSTASEKPDGKTFDFTAARPLD